MKISQAVFHSVLFGMLILFFLSCKLSCKSERDTDKEPATTHKLVFTKVGPEWRVGYEDNISRPVKVGRNHLVQWQAPYDSDVYFQFMDDTLFLQPKYRSDLKAGKILTLTIHPKAPYSTYYYAVFIYKDSTFAVGNSPPNIIVER